MRCICIAQFLVPVFLLFTTPKSQAFTALFETDYSINNSAIAGRTAGVDFKYFSNHTVTDMRLSGKVKKVSF